MGLTSVNLEDKFTLFKEFWSPKCIAKVDNYLVKAAKFKGHFTWHTHFDCDEMFFVHKGKMCIEFRDEIVVVNEGEIFVVEKGREHKPYSKEGCEVILIEKDVIVNTGDQQNEFTKIGQEWI